jgi:hypothetical protein
MDNRQVGVRKWLDATAIRPCMAIYRAILKISRYRIDLPSGWRMRDIRILEANWCKDGLVLKSVMFGLLIISCLGWAAVAGQDINWDFLNYHYYVAHAFWTDRLDKDFMPASIQSYLNPIAYLPIYWMIQAGWHSLVIGLVLAALHSVNLVLLLLIAEKALFNDVPYRHLWGFAAAIVGGLSPVFLSEVGSTFNDVTSTIGILLGLYLILRRVEFSAHVLLAGLAMGIAAGLKLTNTIFIVATVPSLVIAYGAWSTRTRAVLWFGVGVLMGFALSEGYWGYRVYQEFGNPFFPYMNKLFAAPDFPNVNIVNDRFLPHSMWDIVTLPLRMMSIESWVYTEIGAPDLRFMALIVVTGIGLLLMLQRSWRNKLNVEAWSPNRSRMALICFFVVSLGLWLASSANGRYGLPVFLLVGPLLVWAVYWALTVRVAVLVTCVIIVFQIIHMANGPNPRWTPVPWKTHWLDLVLPPVLKEQPSLYLSQGVQSFSFLIPYLHPESAFTNVLGQWAIPTEGHGSARLQAMLHKYDGRTRMLAPFPRDQSVNGKPTKKVISVINASLDRFKLRVVPESCYVFQVHLLEHSALLDTNGIQDEMSAALLSCALTKKKNRDTRLVQEELHVASVYGAFESACPELFSPPGAALERVDKFWKKYYANSDVSLWSDGVWLFYSRTRAIANVTIGKVSDYETVGKNIDCSVIRRPPMRFSSSILPLSDGTDPEVVIRG